MILTGIVLIAIYALLGYATYQALLVVWERRPDPVLALVTVTAFTLVFGYVSHQIGTARLYSALDPVEIRRERAPGLYERVGTLAARLDIEPPRVSVADLGGPNALALGGPRNGEVILDVRLFRLLGEAELEAVIAHELAHLNARDSLLKTLGHNAVGTLAGALFLLLLPIAVVLGGIVRGIAYLRGEHPLTRRQMTRWVYAAVMSFAVVVLFVLTLALQAYSRRREYAADARAAELTGNPAAMARALARIERATTPGGPFEWLYIHGDQEGTLTRLLASHPPIDDRI